MNKVLEYIIERLSEFLKERKANDNMFAHLKCEVDAQRERSNKYYKQFKDHESRLLKLEDLGVYLMKYIDIVNEEKNNDIQGNST